MAEVKNSRQKYRRSENPLEKDFILPTKTNKAIQIIAPPVNSSKLNSAQSSKSDDSPRSHNGSNETPSRSSIGLQIFPTRSMGKPGFLNESPSKITLSVSEQ